MQERREFQRFSRTYTVTFAVKDEQRVVHDMSRTVDISKGGLRFFTQENYDIGTNITMKIRFPFLSPDVTELEGQVANTCKVGEIPVYTTGIRFVNLTPEALAALERL